MCYFCRLGNRNCDTVFAGKGPMTGCVVLFSTTMVCEFRGEVVHASAISFFRFPLIAHVSLHLLSLRFVQIEQSVFEDMGQ